MSDITLEKQIKDANRTIYNSKSVEQYNLNESIFNAERRKNCSVILNNAATASGNEKYLDIGTGTGNLLRLGQNIFKQCYGADISEKLLVKIKNDFPECFLFASDAENIPAQDSTFNCVSCYAMLHHLLKHDKILFECHRILKPGGTLYTDHDPNYFLNRFYHIFYKIRHRRTPGFGSEMEELAEYHNSSSSGINPKKLKKILLNAGFKEVNITYHMTDKSNWTGTMKLLIPILRGLGKVFPAKSFFTHFSIIAIKE